MGPDGLTRTLWSRFSYNARALRLESAEYFTTCDLAATLPSWLVKEHDSFVVKDRAIKRWLSLPGERLL
jgi:hypothetical protein